jgi:hypothetical protein
VPVFVAGPQFSCPPAPHGLQVVAPEFESNAVPVLMQ